MPRDGSGAADNAIEAGDNLVHGATGETALNRASKVAPLPEEEKGGAIEGLSASGGGSAGVQGTTGQGKGNDSNKPAAVDQATQ